MTRGFAGKLRDSLPNASCFDFTGVERLKHRPDEELLLRALVQTFLDHSLCIAEDTPHGRHLVFPSQYRWEEGPPAGAGHLRLLHLQRRVCSPDLGVRVEFCIRVSDYFATMKQREGVAWASSTPRIW